MHSARAISPRPAPAWERAHPKGLDVTNDPCWSAATCAPAIAVWRGAVLESVHYGAIAVADADGRLVACLGDPTLRMYLRSSAKPFQLMAFVERGGVQRFGLTDGMLAVLSASHGAEQFHTEMVQTVLDRIGCTPDDLQCGPHLPMDAASAKAMLATGLTPTTLHSNCSGKHTGMLALARLIDAPLEGYLDPDHAVQRLIRDRVAAFFGVEEADLIWGVDGCGAPAFTAPMWVTAQAYARLVEPPDELGTLAVAARQIISAIRHHPEMIAASTGRLDTELMRLDPRFITKSGADGVFCVGIPAALAGGRPLGVMVKISDGDGQTRARIPAVIEALRQLGALDRSLYDELERRFPRDLKNDAGRVVGRVAPCFELQRVAN
ncbi:MAG: asparaginase [Chloroflexi bacterium]|nr:asparaginase [Chloroflexota bacterium]